MCTGRHGEIDRRSLSSHTEAHPTNGLLVSPTAHGVSAQSCELALRQHDPQLVALPTSARALPPRDLGLETHRVGSVLGLLLCEALELELLNQATT